MELVFDSLTFTAAPTLPPEWAAAPALKLIRLVNIVGLAGGLPATWISGLPALQNLVLDGVSGLSAALSDYASLITDPVHRTAAGNYTGLTHVQLSRLGLAGPPPASLFTNSPVLQATSLAGNQLSGPLEPLWFGANASTALRALDLSANAFTGTLPPQWSGLALAMLSLRQNNLTGFLPAEWAAMPALPNATVVDISYNDLLGPIPAAWSARSSSWGAVVVAGNPRMCGALPSWFSTRFGANATAMTAMYAGESLCSFCWCVAWLELWLVAHSTVLPRRFHVYIPPT